MEYGSYQKLLQVWQLTELLQLWIICIYNYDSYCYGLLCIMFFGVSGFYYYYYYWYVWHYAVVIIMLCITGMRILLIIVFIPERLLMNVM